MNHHLQKCEGKVAARMPSYLHPESAQEPLLRGLQQCGEGKASALHCWVQLRGREKLFHLPAHPPEPGWPNTTLGVSTWNTCCRGMLSSGESTLSLHISQVEPPTASQSSLS